MQNLVARQAQRHPLPSAPSRRRDVDAQQALIRRRQALELVFRSARLAMLIATLLAADGGGRAVR